jgi:hypothetical protein
MLISVRDWVNPRAIEKSHHLIGIRTRGLRLLAISIAPEPSTLRRGGREMMPTQCDVSNAITFGAEEL